MSFKGLLTNEVKNAFEKAGYEKEYGNVSVSNRPDLCMYQCNGCMPLAKIHKKKPLDIANEIADILKKAKPSKRLRLVLRAFLIWMYQTNFCVSTSTK